jgi:tRNA threonylcarbamoyladenosine biosynthesis protein TsaE
MQLIINNLNELEQFAVKLAEKLKPGVVLALEGDLGVGKTALSAFLIRHMTKDPSLDVTSPTFNIVHVYDNQYGPEIWHFDLYRLKSEDEIYELGMEQALENISIIEWPEVISDLLPLTTIKLSMAFLGEGEKRVINCHFLEAL